MPHKRLLLKLNSLGITGTCLSCIKIYLEDRKQVVKIGNFTSSPREVISGVPQGSILGPLLFLAYVSDIPEAIKRGSLVRLFADDTKKFRVVGSREDESALQEDLNSLSDWSSRWLLSFNHEKCKFVRYGTSSGWGQPEYYLDRDKYIRPI